MELGHFGGFCQMGFPSLHVRTWCQAKVHWGCWPWKIWMRTPQEGIWVQTPQFGVVVEAILRLKCWQNICFGGGGFVVDCSSSQVHWNILKLDNFLHGSTARNPLELSSATLLKVGGCWSFGRPVDWRVLICGLVVRHKNHIYFFLRFVTKQVDRKWTETMKPRSGSSIRRSMEQLDFDRLTPVIYAVISSWHGLFSHEWNVPNLLIFAFIMQLTIESIDLFICLHLLSSFWLICY